MKRFTVCLLVAALLSMGIVPQLKAAERPKAMAGVDIESAQPLGDVEAQGIRGEGINWAYIKDRLKNSGDWRASLMGPILSTIYRFSSDKMRKKILDNFWNALAATLGAKFPTIDLRTISDFKKYQKQVDQARSTTIKKI